MSIVHTILRNRLYTGQFEWNGKLIQGKHEPLVNGARNFPNYGEVKFPNLAGVVISRRVDRELRFWAAGRDV